MISKSSLNICLPILTVKCPVCDDEMTPKKLTDLQEVYLRQVYLLQTEVSQDFLKFIRKYFSHWGHIKHWQ